MPVGLFGLIESIAKANGPTECLTDHCSPRSLVQMFFDGSSISPICFSRNPPITYRLTIAKVFHHNSLTRLHLWISPLSATTPNLRRSFWHLANCSEFARHVAAAEIKNARASCSRPVKTKLPSWIIVRLGSSMKRCRLNDRSPKPGSDVRI